MIRRHELTDAEWALLEPLMPAQPRQGHRWADHRTVINGILWRVRTGTPWRDLPERYGNWKTVYGRHRRWSAEGTWAGIADALRIDADTGEATELTASVDSSSARAPSARRRCPPPPAEGNRRQRGPLNREDPDGREAIGRSPAARTTKIHLAADLRCRPLRHLTSPGQRHDTTMLVPVVDALRIGHRGPGRPRTRPSRVIADKAYSSRANRS